MIREAYSILSMRARSTIIRCRKCRRPFSRTADSCPDCGCPTDRKIQRLVIKGVALIVAVAALFGSLNLALRQHVKLPAGQPPHWAAHDEDGGDQTDAPEPEIKFAPK
jgi:ribosomal protein L37E